ncbi:MAG TPA: tetratricopeptide repeat protein [Verrucomicrobiae bacterium]|nr:tetratricopeptide repeat protein [Verrucomicrobiae bacterium]
MWGGLIVLITLLAYMPVWHGKFIWDDSLIVKNRLVKASDGLHRFWFTTQAPDYYPLTWSLWWAEWRWWGDSATGYHVLNVVMHAACAVLIWTILRRLKIPGAWLAGLVFAVHPVNVATVAWVSEQKNTLSMLFYLTAILLYLRFDEGGRWRWYELSWLAFLLALLSKTAVVMLPVVLLGCMWWQHGVIRWKDWLRVMPFFVLALILGLVTVWFQYHRVLGGHRIRTDGFLPRVAAAGWVPWFYLYKALYPSNLCVIYPKWHIDASRWVSYVPGAVILGCLTLFWRKRETWGRSPLFGLGYFVVTLFPVLGFFDQGFYGVSLVADHWQYCSIIGIIAWMVAAGVTLCQRLGPQRQYVGLLAGAAVSVALGTATWLRSRVYIDSRTLWATALVENPNAWLAHNNLGYLLARDGDLVGATWHYEQALRLEPDYAAAHNNLGTALLRAGQIQEAIRHFARAVEIEPDWAAAHNNLGNALLQMGEIQNAVSQFEQAVQNDPDYAEAHYNLGNALWKEGKIQGALEQYQKAVLLDANFAQAHNNLGVLLQADRLPEAVAHYEQALHVNPNYAEAHFNLGNALVQSARTTEAVGHYEEALRLKPDYADAHYNLAMLLASRGDVDQAISHLQSAVSLEPNSLRFRQALDGLERTRGAGNSN